MNNLFTYILFIIIYIILYKLDKKFQLINKLSKVFKIPGKWIPFTMLCMTIIFFLIINCVNLNANLLKFINLILIIPFIISTKYLYRKELR